MTEATLNYFKDLRFLLSIEGIGTNKLLKLIEYFGSPENIFNADVSTLKNIERIGLSLSKRIYKTINSRYTTPETLKKEIDFIEKNDIKISTFFDEDYPETLKNIYSPPLILYYKGNFPLEQKNSISIVGTRIPTHYGKIKAKNFATELAEHKLTIVSGLARGIDSIAHKSALEAGGLTTAVIGSGIDVIYPPENKNLFNQIIEQGVVVSEFPIGTKPDAQNFPKRNRIISALSLGTLVIETGIKGGALQTASFALEQNKEVFAIPGNLGVAQSEGTNLLIQKNGAKLVIKVEDILEEIKYKTDIDYLKKIKHEPINLTLFEKQIYEILCNEPIHIDQIALQIKTAVNECSTILLQMEIKGIIKQLSGKMFIRA